MPSANRRSVGLSCVPMERTKTLETVDLGRSVVHVPVTTTVLQLFAKKENVYSSLHIVEESVGCREVDKTNGMRKISILTELLPFEGKKIFLF